MIALRRDRWSAMAAMGEVVVLVASQQWIWNGCATHQGAPMCGHALKWHDGRDRCGLGRMAEGTALRQGWDRCRSAVDGAVWVV